MSKCFTSIKTNCIKAYSCLKNCKITSPINQNNSKFGGQIVKSFKENLSSEIFKFENIQANYGENRNIFYNLIQLTNILFRYVDQNFCSQCQQKISDNHTYDYLYKDYVRFMRGLTEELKKTKNFKASIYESTFNFFMADKYILELFKFFESCVEGRSKCDFEIVERNVILRLLSRATGVDYFNSEHFHVDINYDLKYFTKQLEQHIENKKGQYRKTKKIYLG
ncbi:hypothetical protein COBT_000022 [Conglomerata obtusa]